MKGKLRWYYSTMGAGKTSLALLKSYQFEETGVKTILLKPAVDTRDFGVVKSRAISGTKKCIVFEHNDNLYKTLVDIVGDHYKTKNIVVFVDEIQFATPDHIVELWKFAKEFKIDVYTFGLKTDADNNLFTPIPKLVIYSDSIKEIKSKCKYCDNKATTHLMYINDNPVISRDYSIKVGDVSGSTRYESLCQCCRSRILSENV